MKLSCTSPFTLRTYFGIRQNSAFVKREKWDVSYAASEKKRLQILDQRKTDGGMMGGMMMFIRLMDLQERNSQCPLKS